MIIESDTPFADSNLNIEREDLLVKPIAMDPTAGDTVRTMISKEPDAATLMEMLGLVDYVGKTKLIRGKAARPALRRAIA